MSSDAKSREELARQANIVRSRLLHTVEQLEQRRHDAFDVGRQLHQHVFELAVVGSALVVLTAATVGLVVHRITTAETRRRRARWALLHDLWMYPERRLPPPRRSFAGEVARSVALGAVTTALSTPAKRVVEQVVRAALEARGAWTPPGPPGDLASPRGAPPR